MNKVVDRMKSPDPRRRKSGVASLGVIAEGCAEKLQEHLQEIMPLLLAAGSDADLRNATFSFKFVRDPYARACSSYAHQTEQNFSGADAVRRRLNASTGADVSFGAWLEAVARVGLRATDVHTRLQVTDAELEGAAYDLLCRVEGDLGACLEVATQRSARAFSLVASDAATHAHAHARYPPGANVAAWPRRRFRGRGLPEAPAFYAGQGGRRAAALVRRIYARDFEAYGYSTDPP